MELHKLNLYKKISFLMGTSYNNSMSTESDYVTFIHNHVKINYEEIIQNYNENNELHSIYDEENKYYIPSIIFNDSFGCVHYIYLFNGRIIDINHPVMLSYHYISKYFVINYHSFYRLINEHPMFFNVSYSDILDKLVFISVLSINEYFYYNKNDYKIIDETKYNYLSFSEEDIKSHENYRMYEDVCINELFNKNMFKHISTHDISKLYQYLKTEDLTEYSPCNFIFAD